MKNTEKTDTTIPELREAGLSETAISYLYENDEAYIYYKGNEYLLYIDGELMYGGSIDGMSLWLEEAWAEEILEMD